MATNGCFTGALKRIGTGTVHQGAMTRTSLLEIGSHALQNIKYSNYIENYLSDGIKSDQPTTIAVKSDLIIAIRVNGKNYYQDIKSSFITNFQVFLGFVIIASTTFGIGGIAIAIWYFYDKSKLKKILAEFERARE